MRISPCIVTLIVCIAHSSCDKPRLEFIPVSGKKSVPEVVLEITPMPSPESTGTPFQRPETIQSQIAPRKGFGVIKSFGVTTEGGIVDFSKGKQVAFKEARAIAQEMARQNQENINVRRIESIRKRIHQLDAGIAAASQFLEEADRAKSRDETNSDPDGNKVDAGTILASGNEFELEQSINVWKQQKAALQEELR